MDYLRRGNFLLPTARIQQMRQTLLLRVIPVMGIGALVALPIVRGSSNTRPILIWTLLAFALLCVPLYRRAKQGAVTSTGILFCTCLILLSAIAGDPARPINPFRVLTEASYLIPSIVGSMVLGSLGCAFFGLLCILSVVVQIFVEPPTSEVALGWVFVNLMVTGMLLFVLRTLEQAVVEAESAQAGSEDARSAAEEANRAKTVFLMMISHELRTPLTLIIGYNDMMAEMMEMNGENHLVPMTQAVRTASRELHQLIENILTFTRLDNTPTTAWHEAFALSFLFEELAHAQPDLLERNGNKLEWLIHPDAATITSDRDRVRQILLHLLSNAAKFTENGTIRINARLAHEEGQPWLCVDVADTGIGMDADQVERLFRPFEQGDSSATRQYGGIGLGLALSQRLCESIGAKLTVTSTLNEGSTFTLWLPMSTALAPLNGRG